MTSQDLHEVAARLDALGHANAFNGKRVLITGARGFLGQAFTKLLAARGATVIAVDRWALAQELGAGTLPTLENVEHWDHDVTQPLSEVSGPIDYVLSLAAIASPVHYARRPLDCFDVIVKGTRNMLDLAQEKGATMLLSSTSELYGDPGVVPTPEYYLGQLNPWDVRGRAYDVPKLAAEALASIYEERGVKVRTVRYFNVYGSGLARGDYRVMTKFAAAAVDGKPLTVFGAGDQTRTFCYLTDALVGTLLVLLNGVDAKPYNVGNDTGEVTMEALARLFSPNVELKTPPDEYRREPRRRCPELSRIRALGYEPQVPLAVGVHRFLDWARETYKT